MPNQRKTVWIDTLHNPVIASGGVHADTLIAAPTSTDQRIAGMTLIRTIICHDYSYAVHDSGEGSQIIDVGIGVTSQEAFASTILPDPNNAIDHPTRGWVYRCRHKIHGFAADQAAVDVRSVYRDIRSKRKIDNGELYIHIVNSALSGAASSIQVIGITRCLFLLS